MRTQAEILEAAAVAEKEFLAAVDWSRANYPFLPLQEAVQKRTHEGAPVGCLLARSPAEAVRATVMGVHLGLLSNWPSVSAALREDTGFDAPTVAWGAEPVELDPEAPYEEHLGQGLIRFLRIDYPTKPDRCNDFTPSELGALVLRVEAWLGKELQARFPDQYKEARAFLSASRECIWDLYMAAFYSVAYQAVDLTDPLEFGRQSFLEPVSKGLWGVICHGQLLIGLVRPPAFRDEQFRLHNPTGPALVWGTPQYFWHGTEVPEEWIKNPKGVDPQLCVSHSNAEQRRALCDILGWDVVFGLLKPEVVEEDADPEIGTLYRAALDGGTQQFLRVRCGTGRYFVLPVPEHVHTAREANAWTYDIPVSEFAPEVRT